MPELIRHPMIFMTTESLNKLDHVRQSFNAATSRSGRSEIGQFLTPVSIADFMSSLFEPRTKKVRILDPGAGTGVLFATCVKRLLSQKKLPTSIEIVAYETDMAILSYLQETMNECAELCKKIKCPSQEGSEKMILFPPQFPKQKNHFFPTQSNDSRTLSLIHPTRKSTAKLKRELCSIQQELK